MIQREFFNYLLILFISFVSSINLGAEELQVYKGELRIVMPGQHEKNALLVQYRTKTREVLRIGITGLVLTNAASKESVRLNDRSSNLSPRLDDGHWITEIVYDDINLTNDDYRIEGNVVFHLAGSQQSRNFSVYLKPESSKAPHGSNIDWGVNH